MENHSPSTVGANLTSPNNSKMLRGEGLDLIMVRIGKRKTRRFWVLRQEENMAPEPGKRLSYTWFCRSHDFKNVSVNIQKHYATGLSVLCGWLSRLF